MIAVVPVRDGTPPLGADEAVAESGGIAVLIGSRTEASASTLTALRHGNLIETAGYAAGAWARGLRGMFSPSDPVPEQDTGAIPSARLAGCGPIVLPASQDGRDLAPRLAFELGIPLLSGAIEVTRQGASLARWGSRVVDDVEVDGPFVATLHPGSRTVRPTGTRPELTELGEVAEAIDIARQSTGDDARATEVLPPDPRTADLAEAPRILGAGAGLTRGAHPAGTDAVRLLTRVGEVLAASVGATRVVTDAGFADYQRQIGTTGVVVNPELYIAFGISGAAQHIGGLGAPSHVVSVNTDASCPMTAMADLGIVTDATALLVELARRVSVCPEEDSCD